MQQLAHMAGVVVHSELLLNHPGDHGRGPDSGVQAIGHRTAVQDVLQGLPVRATQLRRSSAALSFQQTVDAMGFITCQPFGHLGAWGLQNRRQLPAAAPLRIQHDCLQPLGHAIGSVPFRLFAQANQPLIGAGVQTNHSRKHGTPPNGSMPSFFCYVPLIMRICISGRSPDGVGVDWYPDMGSLERRSDGGNDDQVYTIVLEKNTNDEIKAFRLDPNDVAKYFDRGLQINVKADGYQTAGSWPVQVVQKVEVGAMKVADVLKAIIPGSEATISLAANKPTNAGTTDCIRIHTLVASDSPNSDSGQLTAQLEPEPCLMVGQPTTFHMHAYGAHADRVDTSVAGNPGLLQSTAISGLCLSTTSPISTAFTPASTNCDISREPSFAATEISNPPAVCGS